MHEPRLHPRLGFDRRLSDEPQLCSLCGAPIDEGEVPLILFGPEAADGDCKAWVYCDPCGEPVMARAIAARGAGR